MTSTTTSTNTSAVSEVGRAVMRPTVSRGGRRRTYRQPSRLAVLAARELGMRPESVEQMIHGHRKIQDRFAVLVSKAIAVRDDDAYQKLMGPVEAVIANEPIPDADDALDEAADADAREDVSEAEYKRLRRLYGRAVPMEVTRRFLRDSHRDRRLSELRDRAIAREAGLSL